MSGLDIVSKKLGLGPLLVHCDAWGTHSLVRDCKSRAAKLHQHAAILEQLRDGRALMLPSFNYDFLSTRLYDVRADPSQVGPITEFFRTDVATWRSHCPVFNVSGTGAAPDWSRMPSGLVDPFGADSVFEAIVERRGTIIWYGAPISASTIIHHAERISGGPLYRYDKIFRGSIVGEEGLPIGVALNYHVRPLGQHLDYDWTRIEQDLLREGIVMTDNAFPSIRFADASGVVCFWVERLRENPFYLLGEASRRWAESALEKYGRRLLLADFEEGLA